MTRDEIIQCIGVALKHELNSVMSSPLPLDWKAVEKRNKKIMDYIKENLK